MEYLSLRIKVIYITISTSMYLYIALYQWNKYTERQKKRLQDKHLFCFGSARACIYFVVLLIILCHSDGIYNAFIHVQWYTELSYLFISGCDLYRQLFTIKPSFVCVNDNVRKRVFAIFLGGKVGGVSGTYHPPKPVVNKTNKTPHKYIVTCTNS